MAEYAAPGGEALRFFRAWLAAPAAIGAQWPSGAALARVIAEAADAICPGPVVELGPGTGPVTRALLARGVGSERLLLVENNAEFCMPLRRQFPGVEVLHADAFALPRRWRAGHWPAPAVVISGLPLLNWPPKRRLRLLLDWLRVIRPGGCFVQFTYGFASPVPLRPAIAAQATPRIWRNLWPAVVWTYRRQATPQGSSPPG